MALSEVDRQLLFECLGHKPQAWELFVDRFIGLVVHVIQHTAHARSIRLDPADQDDLSAEVFLAFLSDDFAILRRFRGESSLATYLTVIARRVVVRELLKRRTLNLVSDTPDSDRATHDTTVEEVFQRDEVESLLARLDEAEARVVRMHFLEGKTYEEIGTALGMAAGTVGPTLTRAKEKMRRSGVAS